MTENERIANQILLKEFISNRCNMEITKAEKLANQIIGDSNISLDTAKVIALYVALQKYDIVLGGLCAAEILNMARIESHNPSYYHMIYTEHREDVYEFMCNNGIKYINALNEATNSSRNRSIEADIIQVQFNGIPLKVTKPLRIIEDLLACNLCSTNVHSIIDYEQNYINYITQILAWWYANNNQSITKLLLVIEPKYRELLLEIKDRAIALYNENKASYTESNISKYCD